MNEAKPLLFLDYDSVQNPITEIQTHRSALKLGFDQAIYIGRYLKELGAKKIIVEQNYFDRDYLEEYSAFYSKSTRGYGNTCRRVHFFDNDSIDSTLFNAALSDDDGAKKALYDSYLGFSVLRPIPEAQFGRTVLKWYEDQYSPPRIIEPARIYECHIANLTLKVEGLAWQQQDSAVAACATIGLWSMLHSSALNEFHSIPTTTEITEAANQTDTVGVSTFPSRGLTPLQILQAIKQLGFSPTIVQGTLTNQYFTKKAFASTCASFIRSGFPLLLLGKYRTSSGVGHAICAVGFRDSVIPSSLNTSGSPQLFLQDEYVDVLYIHDDNVGPNVRMTINSELLITEAQGTTEEVCVLKMTAPSYINLQDQHRALDDKEFIPSGIVAAVNKDLRICPVQLMDDSRNMANDILFCINHVRKINNLTEVSILHSSRFVQLSEYLKKDLEHVLNNDKAMLGNVRKKILEELPPMSLHIAVLRIASASASGNVLIDLIYDTTDSDRNRPVFGHIIYDPQVKFALDHIALPYYTAQGFYKRFGKPILAY